VELAPGERITGRISGGGGYGDPLERDPDSVRADVAAGIVSPERAREQYGVIVDVDDADGTVSLDREATESCRHGHDSGEGR
jgi:N-methylhydantoinase B